MGERSKHVGATGPMISKEPPNTKVLILIPYVRCRTYGIQAISCGEYAAVASGFSFDLATEAGLAAGVEAVRQCFWETDIVVAQVSFAAIGRFICNPTDCRVPHQFLVLTRFPKVPLAGAKRLRNFTRCQ